MTDDPFAKLAPIQEELDHNKNRRLTAILYLPEV